LRFTFQARGARLLGGVAVIALGLVTTALVIASGENKEGVQGGAAISYASLWTVFKYSVFGLSLAALAGTAWSFFVLDPKRKIERWTMFTAAMALLAASAWLYFGGEQARVGDSGMRILWQLIKASAASAVLLGGCFMVFKKRAGIVLLHFGIGLLMGYELWVARTHVEAQVTLEESQPSSKPERTLANWAFDIRELELAIIERGAGEGGSDRTIAIPQSTWTRESEESLARRGRGLMRLLSPAKRDEKPEFQVISDERLPFDLQVLAFYVNSTMHPVRPGEPNVADSGHGKFWMVTEAPPVTGVDNDKENHPAAYVKLIDRTTQEPISTHLVSIEQTYFAQWAPTELDRLEELRVAGKKYEIYLRFKRVNKPYTVQLENVKREDYIGTVTPKN
jgi:hypothetical protein